MKLKYKRILLFITMCTMCIGMVTLSISDSSNKKTKANNQNTDDPNVIDKKQGDDTNTNAPTPTNSPVIGTSSSQWETIPEINTLVENYFTASMNYDKDALELLVSNIDNINEAKIKSKYEFIEAFENIECYIKAVPNNKSYLVYVCVDWKIKSVDTFAPGLDFLYICQLENGSYRVYNNEIDSTTQKFVQETDQSEEVLSLIRAVNLRYQEAVTKDAKLQELNSKLDDTKISPEPQPSESPSAVSGE